MSDKRQLEKENRALRKVNNHLSELASYYQKEMLRLKRKIKELENERTKED